MDKAHLLQRFFNSIFPHKEKEISQKWELLPLEEKKDLALKYLQKADTLLASGNLKALEFYEMASSIDPDNEINWFRQGCSFYNYARKENQEKALQLASKNFSKAVTITPSYFDAWLYWGKTLLELGKFHSEIHFLNDAKEKFQYAIELSKNHSLEKKGNLYWELGLLWTAISEHSGEAVDLRMAIQAFHTSFSFLKEKAPARFWKDFGFVYLQMGLLINECKMYFQAIKNFRKYIKECSDAFDGWALLAQTYTQLYINTIDEHYYNHANECFKQALNINNKDPDLWLHWAQLLGESGYINKDLKKLQLSIEKCVRAQNIDPKQPDVIAQWTESLSYMGKLSNRLDLLIEAENKILKAIDQFPDEPEVWHAYGVCLIAFGQYYDDPDFFEMAMEKLRYGISLDGGCAELWYLLGCAYFEMAQNLEDVDLFKQSCEFFSRACDLKTACPSLNFDYAKALFKYSEYAADLDALKQVKPLLESVLRIHKSALLQHPEWLFYYGRVLQLYGELADEEKHLIRAIEIYLHVLLVEPDYPEIYFFTATCFTRLAEITNENETFKRAINYFLLSAKQDPENDQIWLEWGLTLIHLAEISPNSEEYFYEAEQKIMKSGQLGNQDAYYQLACLCSLTQRFDQALAFIERAQKHDALPPIEEIMEDEWLEDLRLQDNFTQFISCLETNQKTVDEH